MRRCIEVIGVEPRVSKENKEYFITHVKVDDGTECEYYGKDVAIGDELEVFYHYEKVKARKTKPRLDIQ